MHDENRRPLSVWLTQAILFFGILQTPFLMLFGLSFCISQNKIQQCLSQPQVLFALSIGTAMLVFLLVAFRGIQKRKLYGKWLGAIFLVVSMIASMGKSPYFQLLYASIAQGKPLPTPLYEWWVGDPGSSISYGYGYSSYLDLALRGALDILFPRILIGLLAVRLLSSRAAKSFFGPVEKQTGSIDIGFRQ